MPTGCMRDMKREENSMWTSALEAPAGAGPSAVTMAGLIDVHLKGRGGDSNSSSKSTRVSR